MKTTKEIIHDESVISNKIMDKRFTKNIKLESYIEIRPESINLKWFSVSDVEQLQKELKDRVKFKLIIPKDFIYWEEVEEVFNNFKGK